MHCEELLIKKYSTEKVLLSNSGRTLLGSKKVSSGCPGQVDFPVGQVTFILTCPMGKGPGKLSANEIVKRVTYCKTCPGQAKFQSYLSKGQAGIQVFFEPCFKI